MHFPISYAGFFAKSHMMFFLLSSFLFCLPLKNDGSGELRFGMTVNDLLPKKKRIRTVSRPRFSGKVSTDRLTEGASMSRYVRIVSYRTAVNTCLLFLNGDKKQSGIE